MEAEKTLTNEEIIRELLDLLKKNTGLSTLFQTNFFRLFFRYCTGV